MYLHSLPKSLFRENPLGRQQRAFIGKETPSVVGPILKKVFIDAPKGIVTGAVGGAYELVKGAGKKVYDSFQSRAEKQFMGAVDELTNLITGEDQGDDKGEFDRDFGIDRKKEQGLISKVSSTILAGGSYALGAPFRTIDNAFHHAVQVPVELVKGAGEGLQHGFNVAKELMNVAYEVPRAILQTAYTPIEVLGINPIKHVMMNTWTLAQNLLGFLPMMGKNDSFMKDFEDTGKTLLAYIPSIRKPLSELYVGWVRNAQQLMINTRSSVGSILHETPQVLTAPLHHVKEALQHTALIPLSPAQALWDPNYMKREREKSKIRQVIRMKVREDMKAEYAKELPKDSKAKTIDEIIQEFGGSLTDTEKKKSRAYYAQLQRKRSGKSKAESSPTPTPPPDTSAKDAALEKAEAARKEAEAALKAEKEKNKVTATTTSTGGAGGPAGARGSAGPRGPGGTTTASTGSGGTTTASTAPGGTTTASTAPGGTTTTASTAPGGTTTTGSGTI